MLDLPVDQIEDEPDEDGELPEPEAAPPPIQRGHVRPEVAPAPAAPPRMEKPVEAPAPPRRSQPRQEPVPPPPSTRAYPASYMVVETSTPSYLAQQGQSAADAGLGPRMVPAAARPASAAKPQETPGGQHELEAEEPSEDQDSPPEDWVPFQSSWQPSEQTWKPLARTWEQARTVPGPAPAPRRFPDRLPPLTRRPTPGRPWRRRPRPLLGRCPARPHQRAPWWSRRQRRRKRRPARILRSAGDGGLARRSHPPGANAVPGAGAAMPREPERSVLLWPLVAFNVVFDAFLTPWGPLGAGLKNRGGRNFLAFVGVLCLLGAIALGLIDWFGWTW